jgi:Helix-turn-helix domain
MRFLLKVAILQSGQTQRAVARRAKMPEQRLSDIVRGSRHPRPEERAVLTRVLRLKPEAFDLSEPARG